jgi:hypothetical protein
MKKRITAKRARSIQQTSLGQQSENALETPTRKAAHTGKWARTLAKWLITRSRSKRRWEVVNFTGKHGAESRGIVDLLAIRKDHRALETDRGDYFDMILIQVKGGTAPWPTEKDVDRLRAVQQRYHARAVVLAVWKRGELLELYELDQDTRAAAERPLDRRSLWKRVAEPVSLFR